MESKPYGRRQLIRDGLAFQLKLGLDALRDLFLSPIGFYCVLIDLLRNTPPKDSLFHRLMLLGHKSDSWINLFGTRYIDETDRNEASVDELFARLEVILNDQHTRGGLSRNAKTTIDTYLNRLTELGDKRKKNAASSEAGPEPVQSTKD